VPVVAQGRAERMQVSHPAVRRARCHRARAGQPAGCGCGGDSDRIQGI